ncbi:MAG: DUF397 domain-containing protein [Umezawaea sp.]
MRNNRGQCSPAGRTSTTVERIAMSRGLIWRKSSYSGANESDCVEVAFPAVGVAVRDSKNTTGPVLAFPLVQWREFLARV